MKRRKKLSLAQKIQQAIKASRGTHFVMMGDSVLDRSAGDIYRNLWVNLGVDPSTVVGCQLNWEMRENDQVLLNGVVYIENGLATRIENLLIDRQAMKVSVKDPFDMLLQPTPVKPVSLEDARIVGLTLHENADPSKGIFPISLVPMHDTSEGTLDDEDREPEG